MSSVTAEASLQGPVPDLLWKYLVGQTRDVEPPAKRQKVSNGTVEIPQDEVTKFITLARITLNIIYDEPAASSKESTSDEINGASTPVPVLFWGYAYYGSSKGHRLQLKSENRCLVFNEFFYSPDVSTHCDHFRNAALVSVKEKFPVPVCLTRSTLRALSTDRRSFQLETTIVWKDSAIIPNRVPSRWDNILEFYCPKGSPKSSLVKTNGETLDDPKHSTAWTPRDFYDNVHVPDKTIAAPSEIKSPKVHCQLYPFQKRAVRWLLKKEGVEILPTGEVRPRPASSSQELPHSFSQTVDIDGRPCYVSHLFRVMLSDISLWTYPYQSLRGGILAEEMGLGKTVELITLICLHPRRFHHSNGFSGLSDRPKLKQSGATLIISPPAILEQWKQEIYTHAPSLRVTHYEGIQRHQKELNNDELVQTLSDSDIVITTYNVLSREVHYAGDAPKHNLRRKKRFEPRKTPLVQISWWRVCLDEAQMIESGVGNAARVARLIPRHNAWAISGTPIRKDATDLFGLLLFLHYEPFCNSQLQWALLMESYKPVLKGIIGEMALRHTKHFIRDELSLPPQKRIVITVPFTAVEEQHYNGLFTEMCEACDLDSSGGPLTHYDPNSSATIEKMRTWLMRLRQTCLHPEVSGANRRALGFASNVLRSVSEVLEVMIEQNITSIRTEERAFILSQVRRGQVLENAHSRQDALGVWKKALDTSKAIIKECRYQLAGKLSGAEDGGDAIAIPGGEEEGADKTTRVAVYRHRLRSALELEHVCTFFTANAYFQIKSDPELVERDSERFKELEKLEEEAYESAKQIRKELLGDAIRRVGRYTDSIQAKDQQKEFVKLPRMQPETYDGGLQSQKLVDKLEDICEILNDHAQQYDEWRDKMVKLLLESLIDQDDGTQLEGDEYETSTKHQDEMYVYMEALRAMFADRHGAITGQTNELIAHETKQGIRMAENEEGPSPELYLSIVAIRETLRPSPELGSLRGIISELRSMIGTLEWQDTGGNRRARAELEIAKAAFHSATEMSAEQSKVLLSLEKEVEHFRDTMNNRIEYYRQLQQISDTVAPYDEANQGKPLDHMIFTNMEQNEGLIDGKISALKSKLRYLVHIRDESGEDETSRICVICHSSFEIGVLTVCGHKYCKDCLRMWWGQHRTCPTCKKFLKSSDFHQITYKPKELVVQEERSTIRNRSESKKQSIYSDISTGVLRAIRNIDLDGSFGTKVDTLCRHLVWLRENDPGAKSIVFSQYKDFLGVLATAFRRFKIGFTSVDGRDGIEKFKRDASTECFLLHARAHSSGLNLINATHVFLCEPLINTAIELQAIARVHRIGQHNPTTVWMYLVSYTVEESVYDISVSRRLAHIAENERRNEISDINEVGQLVINNVTETAIDDANTSEVQDAPVAKLMAGGAANGEMVGKDDLWQCLFGKAGRNGLVTSESTEERHREIGRFLRGEAAEGRRDAEMNGVSHSESSS